MHIPTEQVGCVNKKYEKMIE